MRLLLDTHVLIWALADTQRLKPRITAAIESTENEVMFSAASIWEMSIKETLGRTRFPKPVDRILDAARTSGFIELPVRADTALAVAGLPMHHRDPFDRLLVAQALALPAHLLTADIQLQRYSELVTLV